jgi:hypothetical protein
LIAAYVMAIEPMSPPADALAVGGPPAARTHYEGCAEAITSAISSAAAIEATTAAAIDATAAEASSATTVRLCRGGRRAYQNSRCADEVDEEQSQRCEAAGQDVVAFSHSRISRSLPKHLHFGTISLRRARKLSVQMC